MKLVSWTVRLYRQSRKTALLDLGYALPAVLAWSCSDGGARSLLRVGDVRDPEYGALDVKQSRIASRTIAVCASEDFCAVVSGHQIGLRELADFEPVRALGVHRAAGVAQPGGEVVPPRWIRVDPDRVNAGEVCRGAWTPQFENDRLIGMGRDRDPALVEDVRASAPRPAARQTGLADRAGRCAARHLGDQEDDRGLGSGERRFDGLAGVAGLRRARRFDRRRPLDGFQVESAEQVRRSSRALSRPCTTMIFLLLAAGKARVEPNEVGEAGSEGGCCPPGS